MVKKLKGIDVSTWQGIIDWEKVKPYIDFAILRCGYGADISTKDDNTYLRNVAECERMNIPYAVYLYSYATTNSAIDSEVAHALRLVNGYSPFCIYIDMEEEKMLRLSKQSLTNLCKRFCQAVSAAGYRGGVYSNQNWFSNYIDVAELYKAGCSIWCAKWSKSEPKIVAPFDIWQYSEKGSVIGINGNVDMNYMYSDIRIPNIPNITKKTNEELAKEVIQGKWGSGQARKDALTKAGYNYSEVQSIVNEMLKPKTTVKTNEQIAKEVIQGKWGNGAERKRRLQIAGYNYITIQNIVNEMLRK